MIAVYVKIASMINSRVIKKSVPVFVLISTLLIASGSRAYAGTKLFGWDIGATYSSIKQTIMHKVFGFSLPQSSPIPAGQNDINKSSDIQNAGTKSTGLKLDPTDKKSFIQYSFTEAQVNTLIKTQVVGKNLGNGIVVKSANVEFLADNTIALSAQVTANNDPTKPISASAKIRVVENGTRLKIDSLNVDGMGIAGKFMAPAVIKYLESQQDALIKKYVPTDFAFVEIEENLATVHMTR